MLMPIYNALGRSFHKITGGEDRDRAREKHIDALRKTVIVGVALKALQESEGFKCIADRCASKIAALQVQLESADAEELKQIQGQIRVLRDVSTIDKELTAADEARQELTELTNEN